MSCIKDSEIKPVVRRALKEDASTRDITTLSLIPRERVAKAVFLAKKNCVVCGLHVAALVFNLKDKSIKFRNLVKEGDSVGKGKALAVISGSARSILSAERTALNFLCLLSGVATKTREFVIAARPWRVKITDTRKTLPGLRLLQKYAVRVAGGFNHRHALDRMILVKDNHLKLVEGYNRMGGLFGNKKGSPVELEVSSLREYRAALKLNPDIIMLDNMSLKEMKKAVQIRRRLSHDKRNPKPKLEVSGGITLKNIKRIASLGVEMISVGELTHSVTSADISLEII